jgi:hypothetical protein
MKAGISAEVQRKIDELVNAVEDHHKALASFNWQTLLADLIAAFLKALQGSKPVLHQETHAEHKEADKP